MNPFTSLDSKPSQRKVSVEDVNKAIEVILQDRKSYTTSLNYAINYCKEAIGMDGEELRVQCLYILNNITHWRHPKAKEVRQVLKDYSKSSNR